MPGKRPFYKRAWDFLGSRDLSVFIFVMGMTYFFILIIFGMVIPPPSVHNISKLLPYKVFYILFFINLIVCEIKWMPVVIRRCRKPKPPEAVEEMERFGHKTTVQSSEFRVQSLEKYLMRRGYKVQGLGIRSQGSDERITSSLIPHPSSLLLYAYKGRFSPIGNLLFHLSFLFFLTGVGISLLYRFDGTYALAERQGATGDAGEFTALKAAPLASPPRLVFEVEKITPAFWKDILLFTDLKADISYGYREKGIARLSSPLVMDGARITITGMGVTPAYALKDGAGNLLDEGYVSLNIFAPGGEDAFQIPEIPYRIYVSFLPDYEFKNGRASSRSMNPVNPAFEVRVLNMRNKKVYQGILMPGEEASFDGYRLSFGDISYAGIFKVVKDRGFVFIWTGFVLMIAGLVWRLLFYRKEIVVLRGEEGALYLSGDSEYCRRLFAKELESIAGMG